MLKVTKTRKFSPIEINHLIRKDSQVATWILYVLITFMLPFAAFVGVPAYCNFITVLGGVN